MLHSHLLQKARHTLQWLIPLLVMCDTVHSFAMVTLLYKQRLQGWDEEEDTQMQQQSENLIQHLCKRCAAEDADFWPTALNNRFQVVSLTDTAADEGKQLPSISDTTEAPPYTPKTHPQNTPAPAQNPTTNNKFPQQIQEEYQLPPSLYGKALQWALNRCNVAAKHAGEYANTVGGQLEVQFDRKWAHLQQQYNLPQVQLKRKSALRFSLRWQGVDREMGEMKGKTPSVEVLLGD